MADSKTDILERIKANLRITKVVATRSVKGRSGDQFAGFAASYNSVQDEPLGAGKDLLSMDEESAAQQGMTLMEARIAFFLVAQQADIAAHEAALMSGGLSPAAAGDMIKSIRNNYAKMIARELRAAGAEDDVAAK